MSVINTNVLSLTAQNNLERSQSSLATAIQRLSSGLKINSAKDDAAGQAIANRFTANIKGLDKARSNANDAISLAQTTEGALKEINNNLLRIRELTVQAINGTNSASDRTSMQDEIRLRLEEIDRVSAQTQFNGTKVLSKDQRLGIQVGANDRETISIGMAEISSKTLTLDGFNVEKKATVNSIAGPVHLDGTMRLSTAGLGNAVNGIAAGAQSDLVIRFDDASGISYIEVTNAGAGKDGLYELYVDATNGGTGIKNPSAGPVSASGPADELKKIDFVQLKVKAPADHKLVTLTDDNGQAQGTALHNTKTGQMYAYDVGATGDLTIKSIDYTDATGQIATGQIEFGGVDGKTKVVNVGAVAYKADELKTAGLATGKIRAVETPTVDPLKALDAALSKVDKLSSNLGAVQNRLQSTIANLSNTTENLQAARSRIMDANYATEVSNMSRAQIIQKAGMSVLAQANQVSQDVLSLLR